MPHLLNKKNTCFDYHLTCTLPGNTWCDALNSIFSFSWWKHKVWCNAMANSHTVTSSAKPAGNNYSTFTGVCLLAVSVCFLSSLTVLFLPSITQCCTAGCIHQMKWNLTVGSGTHHQAGQLQITASLSENPNSVISPPLTCTIDTIYKYLSSL